MDFEVSAKYVRIFAQGFSAAWIHFLCSGNGQWLQLEFWALGTITTTAKEITDFKILQLLIELILFGSIILFGPIILFG